MPAAQALEDITEFSFAVPCQHCAHEESTVHVTAKIENDNLRQVIDEQAICEHGHAFDDEVLFLTYAIEEFERLVEGRKLGAI